jgi:response regulator RpfG family c-di-GMP phosphodiesterase
MANSVNAAHPSQKPSYFEVSPHLIVPSTFGGFAIYLKQQNRMVLYAARGDEFTAAHRSRLMDMGVKKIWVEGGDRAGYEEYVRAHLSTLVGDDYIPVQERAEAWCGASETMIREMFDLNTPDEQLLTRFSRVRSLLRNTLKFFSDPAVLREMSRFLRNGFESHKHGLGVMVLAATVLDTYEGLPPSLLTACCAGAVLHDIGKSRLSERLRHADPETLDPEALSLWRSHPSVGVSICSRLPLEQETLQCILFHHEREDGKGFPSGGRGTDLPFYPRVIGLCNAYDNLVRGGPESESLTAFQALSRIKEDRGAYAPDLLRRLITVLSKAEMI